MTDSSGGQLGYSRYYPYGSTRDYLDPLDTTRKFTGQRLDSTGLYYYGARYYDPTIGRFISADTIVPNPANPQSLNRYSYCINNPLRYTDPTGHEGEEAAAALAPIVIMIPGVGWYVLAGGVVVGLGYGLYLLVDWLGGLSSSGLSPLEQAALQYDQELYCERYKDASGPYPTYHTTITMDAMVENYQQHLEQESVTIDSLNVNVSHAESDTSDGPDEDRNWRQDRPLSNEEENRLKEGDPPTSAHELKKLWGGSGELWVDREGNIVVKQNGQGPGDWTGKNINNY